MSSAQLKKLADDGKLKASDQVQVDGGSWKPIASVKGLGVSKPSSSAAAPPPIPHTASESPPTSPSGATPFPEWYATKWPSNLRWYFQVPLWLFYGFVWIPVWYVLTTTAGGVKERWAGLPWTGKAIACLPLLLPFVLVGGFSSSNSPSSGRISSNRSGPFEGEADTEVANSGPPHGQLAGTWKTKGGTIWKLTKIESGESTVFYEDKVTGANIAFSKDGRIVFVDEHMTINGTYKIHEGGNRISISGLGKVDGTDVKALITDEWSRIDGKGYKPFITVGGSWKCRKTGLNFHFKQAPKSSSVGRRTATFAVDKAGEVWSFNFDENGIVYAHPKKNVANSRSRIGKFSYDGTTLIIKLALTAVRADLGKIPWEYEFELQRY